MDWQGQMEGGHFSVKQQGVYLFPLAPHPEKGRWKKKNKIKIILEIYISFSKQALRISKTYFVKLGVLEGFHFSFRTILQFHWAFFKLILTWSAHSNQFAFKSLA